MFPFAVDRGSLSLNFVFFFQNANYNPSGSSGFANDIALIRTQFFDFFTLVQPIAMANFGDNFDNELCTISGWGQTGGKSL